jgi:hypothetical protein
VVLELVRVVNGGAGVGGGGELNDGRLYVSQNQPRRRRLVDNWSIAVDILSPFREFIGYAAAARIAINN